MANCISIPNFMLNIMNVIPTNMFPKNKISDKIPSKLFININLIEADIESKEISKIIVKYNEYAVGTSTLIAIPNIIPKIKPKKAIKNITPFLRALTNYNLNFHHNLLLSHYLLYKVHRE